MSGYNRNAPLLETGPIGAVVAPVVGFIAFTIWWCVKELLKN